MNWRLTKSIFSVIELLIITLVIIGAWTKFKGTLPASIYRPTSFLEIILSLGISGSLLLRFFQILMFLGLGKFEKRKQLFLVFTIYALASAKEVYAFCLWYFLGHNFSFSLFFYLLPMIMILISAYFSKKITQQSLHQ